MYTEDDTVAPNTPSSPLLLQDESKLFLTDLTDLDNEDDTDADNPLTLSASDTSIFEYNDSASTLTVEESTSSKFPTSRASPELPASPSLPVLPTAEALDSHPPTASPASPAHPPPPSSSTSVTSASSSMHSNRPYLTTVLLPQGTNTVLYTLFSFPVIVEWSIPPETVLGGVSVDFQNNQFIFKFTSLQLGSFSCSCKPELWCRAERVRMIDGQDAIEVQKPLTMPSNFSLKEGQCMLTLRIRALSTKDRAPVRVYVVTHSTLQTHNTPAYPHISWPSSQEANVIRAYVHLVDTAAVLPRHHVVRGVLTSDGPQERE